MGSGTACATEKLGPREAPTTAAASWWNLDASQQASVGLHAVRTSMLELRLSWCFQVCFPKAPECSSGSVSRCLLTPWLPRAAALVTCQGPGGNVTVGNYTVVRISVMFAHPRKFGGQVPDFQAVSERPLEIHCLPAPFSFHIKHHKAVAPRTSLSGLSW